MPKQHSLIYHFAARWSVEHTKENQRILFNWLKNHANKFIFQAELTINYNEETGEEKRNPHYQVYFHSKDKKRPGYFANIANAMELRGMEFQAASDKGKEHLKEYCMKEDRVAGPWADKRLYMGKNLPNRETLYPWQKTCLEMLEQEPDDTTMHWVVDTQGQTGKTKFIKYYCWKYDGCFLTYGKASDLLNLVSKFPNKNAYLFNLTRTKSADISELEVYAAIEAIKDGMFNNTKYETAQVFMDEPHVWVFANHPPYLGQITASRWKVWEIVDRTLVPGEGIQGLAPSRSNRSKVP